MIFRKSPMAEKSVLNLLTSPVFLKILLAAFALVSAVSQGAGIKLGIEDKPVILNIEKLNEPNTDHKLSPVQQTTPAEIPASAFPPAADPLTEISRELPHVLQKPVANNKKDSKPTATVDRVLSPPAPQTDTLQGPGEKELLANQDGEVSLKVYLSTYEPAEIKVRLIDAEGSEVWFDGYSLLLWRRPDDKNYAPLKFKGREQPGSMYENKEGDYSPNLDLDYKFNIKKGQKIQLLTGGKALPSSYIKVSSSVF